MLEMVKLTRYEHAPVVRFGPGFDAQYDASELAAWLADFTRDKGRPPKRLAFTFHASDDNAEDICSFMRFCVNNPQVADVMSQAAIDLTFVGSISNDVAQSTHRRILNKAF